MKFEPSIKASHPRGSGDLVNSLDSPANTARRAWRFRGNDIRVILVAALVIMCGIFASCGSDNLAIAPSGNLTIEPDNLPINLQVSESDVIPAVVSGDPERIDEIPAGVYPVLGHGAGMTDENTNVPTYQRTNVPSVWRNLLNSRSYSGYIAVMFKEATGVRLREAEKIVRGCNDSTVVRRGISSFTEEQIELAVENAARAGVQLPNWNLYYTIEERNPSRAESLIEELKKDPAVEYIHPIAISEPAEVTTTADLSGEQDYLQPNETHGGLNVVAGWEAGATGKDVIVVDEEINWNYDHEDLPIDITDVLYSSPPINYKDQKFIDHGTAVVGILAGKDNGGGVKGIVHDSIIKIFQVSGATGSPIGNMISMVLNYWLGVSSEKPELLPGDVIIIEVQSPGPTTTSGCTVGDVPTEAGAGCVPEEAFATPFTAFKSAVNTGFILVEGAGNGSLDLSSPEAHIINGPDLSVESSGAIMVGASKGANHEKASWTNCGQRVDVYGWGQGVVTAGYGNHPASDPNDQNKWYTNTFGGTSSATAMVGGAVAQIQSYVKKLFSDAGMINLKTVYLTASQIKDILLATGVPAVNDGGCNIGKQPDVGAAIAYAKDKILSGELIVGVHPDPLNKNVISGIRYDMDGDGRAELISFSRDHKWYIDLSGTPCTSGATCGDDGYGAWDLIIPSPLMGDLPANGSVAGGQGEGSMLFPVVHDYNSDGRADLALYDSINGKYYIKYTTSALITPSPLVGEGGGEGVIEWDRIIDYTTDPAWKPYSRPVPGDYDGDNWLDTALQTPDGHWLIDYGGFDGVKLSPSPKPSPLEGEGEGGGAIAVQYLDHFGSFDKDVKYLTDEQLAQAPGWAYMPIPIFSAGIAFKVPDGVESNANQLMAAPQPDYEKDNYGTFNNYSLGDNDVFLVSGWFISDDVPDIGLKNVDGTWLTVWGDAIWAEPPMPISLDAGYGDINCRPIPADYNGDGKDDTAVQCGTMWKIAYSDSIDFREIELDQALDPVPAYVYAGGIKYQNTKDLYNYYKTELGGTKDSTIFDAPPPIGPYFAQCVKYWAPNASYCWDK